VSQEGRKKKKKKKFRGEEKEREEKTRNASIVDLGEIRGKKKTKGKEANYRPVHAENDDLIKPGDRWWEKGEKRKKKEGGEREKNSPLCPFPPGWFTPFALDWKRRGGGGKEKRVQEEKRRGKRTRSRSSSTLLQSVSKGKGEKGTA